MAHLAEEVGVHVCHRAGRIAVADLVLDRSASVLDIVDQTVLEKVSERAEDARAVHGPEHALQLAQRDGTRGREHRLQHQDAIRRGLDAPFFQPFDVFAVVHWRSEDGICDAKIVHIAGFSAFFCNGSRKKAGRPKPSRPPVLRHTHSADRRIVQNVTLGLCAGTEPRRNGSPDCLEQRNDNSATHARECRIFYCKNIQFFILIQRNGGFFRTAWPNAGQ